MDHARMITENNKRAVAEDAEYLSKLRRVNKEGLSINTHASSHHLESIKAKINNIVEEEVHKLQFKDKLAAEELAASQYQEVLSKKNFFFEVDESKKSKNLKIHNFNAPGNTYRHP